MSRSDDAVARLAVSVADGDAIDWSRADADLAHNERRLLRHLRLVESIATLHRSAPAEHTPEFETVSSEPEGPRWGPLVVLERIGEGASSDVFRAWDSGLHRHVALKLIREDGLGASDALQLATAAAAVNVTRHGLASGDGETVRKLVPHVVVEQIS